MSTLTLGRVDTYVQSYIDFVLCTSSEAAQKPNTTIDLATFTTGVSDLTSRIHAQVLCSFAAGLLYPVYCLAPELWRCLGVSSGFSTWFSDVRRTDSLAPLPCPAPLLDIHTYIPHGDAAFRVPCNEEDSSLIVHYAVSRLCAGTAVDYIEVEVLLLEANRRLFQPLAQAGIED